MDKSTAVAYIDSIIEAYETSMRKDQETYRLVWLSENDIKALKVARRKLDVKSVDE